MKIDRIILAENLRYQLQLHGLTQKALSDKMIAKGYPLHYNYITRIMTGNRFDSWGISLKAVKKIAATLKIHVADLLGVTVNVRAPQHIEDLLRSKNDLRYFLRGADNEALEWAYAQLVNIRQTIVARRTRYIEAANDPSKIRAYLLTGVIDDTTRVRYRKRPFTSKRSLSKAKPVSTGSPSQTPVPPDRDDKILPPMPGRPSSPTQGRHTGL